MLWGEAAPQPSHNTSSPCGIRLYQSADPSRNSLAESSDVDRDDEMLADRGMEKNIIAVGKSTVAVL